MITSITPLTIRIIVIAAVAMTIGALMLGSESSVGFGVVRDSQSVAPPAGQPDVAQRLSRLHASLAIEPAQEANWAQFADRMRDLDLASRRSEATFGKDSADGADERARHALLFAVALNEIDGVLSTRQSALLQREARALGSSFICAEERRDGS